MSDKIVNHLLGKKDHKDDLEGITLFLYEINLKKLSDQIMVAVIDLLSKGLIVESTGSAGQKYYKLSSHAISALDKEG